ncbi:hypothetical protein SRHO_G00126810 [Serrasalmus rhombeus]
MLEPLTFKQESMNVGIPLIRPALLAASLPRCLFFSRSSLASLKSLSAMFQLSNPSGPLSYLPLIKRTVHLHTVCSSFLLQHLKKPQERTTA